LLPFKELKNYTPPEKPDITGLYIHIDAQMKAGLIKAIKHKYTLKGFFAEMIKNYLDGVNEILKPKAKQKTGRGNKGDDHEQVKGLLRKVHPETLRKVEISVITGIPQDRVMIILNNLSGVNESEIDHDFLVYSDEENKYTEYGIAKDKKTGIG